MKRITQKPWFGKKIVGYGPAPATWQGWIITILLILTVILDFLHFRISITSIIIFIIAIIVFFCNHHFNRLETRNEPKKKRESTNYSNISNHFNSSNSSFRHNDIFKTRFHSKTNREYINCYCVFDCLFNIHKKIIENLLKKREKRKKRFFF